MSGPSGFKSKIVDAAFEQIGRKYPNFDTESGKRVVGSLTDAYKSFHKRRKELKMADPIPVTTANAQPVVDANRSPTEKRLSFYDNFDDDKMHSSSLTKQFPADLVPETRVAIEDGTEKLLPTNGVIVEESQDIKSVKPPDCVPVPPLSKPEPSRPDISQYLQKKSLAQGMLDLALLSANTNQLRYILDSREENLYFTLSLSLIISSLVLQIVVGLMLIWNSNYNVQRKAGFASADRINNLSVFGVFLITLINVFISTFGNVSGGTAPVSVVPKIDATLTPAPVDGGSSTVAVIQAPPMLDIPPASVDNGLE